MQLLGSTAAELLVRLMRGETPSPTHIRMPTRLVVRATTAPPR
jgi:LacI family transcriptional regulator